MSKKGQEIVIWGLIILGLGAIVLGIYAAVATPAQQQNSSEMLLTPVASDEQSRGRVDAKVVLVEYSDFECPACKYYYGMVKQLEQEKGDQVRFVFRHYPLPQHKSARIAALAAEAAGKQGKFWEMHDVLFERQDEWTKSENVQQTLTGYAALIGLDVGKFALDAQLPELGDRIDQDMTEGTQQRIQGTPTFFLNGKTVQFRSYEDLKNLVEGELNK